MLDIGKDHLYQTLCEQMGVALIAIDTDLNIGLWNAAAARMFGAGSQRMIDTSIIQIIPKDQRDQAESIIRHSIQSGETEQLEFEYRDDHGAKRELVGIVTALVMESGQRIGASICFRDITKRMDLQDQLHENRKMVALGEMAGALSHHFNNILGGAITSIDYANATEDPNMKSRVLTHVETALQRATTLMDGLLAFSASDHRIDNNTPLSEVLRTVLDETRIELHEGPIEFSSEVTSDLDFPVPRKPVITILRNIIRNAIEAMPNGGRLSLHAEADDIHVTVSISDTGCGLPIDSKSRIFEPFWSTKDMLTAKSGEATGLGLAVVHGLAQMMGGSIHVDSIPGKGSTFQVQLPIHP